MRLFFPLFSLVTLAKNTGNCIYLHILANEFWQLCNGQCNNIWTTICIRMYVCVCVRVYLCRFVCIEHVNCHTRLDVAMYKLCELKIWNSCAIKCWYAHTHTDTDTHAHTHAHLTHRPHYARHTRTAVCLCVCVHIYLCFHLINILIQKLSWHTLARKDCKLHARSPRSLIPE